MARVLVVLLALFSLGFQAAGVRPPASESIKKEDLKADLFFLAGDGFKGRLTDTPENTLAAEWIKFRFEKMGLKPAGPGGSYFQPFNLVTTTLGDPNTLQVVTGDADRMMLKQGQDYYPQSFSASAHVRGSLAFAGFGITSPDLNYDDYKGKDIAGKIVLVIDHEPGERDPNSPFDGVVTAEDSTGFRKALAAQAKGAIGILFVSDVHNHPEVTNFEATARNFWPAEQPRIRRFTLQTWANRIRIPAAQISPALADTLLKGSGKTLEQLAKSAETASGIVPLPVPGPQVELTATVDRHIVPDRNVIGMIEGSDPRLKDEVVIISGHHDHNGADSTQIFNGADDNGSGTVVMIEIAEAYMAGVRAGQRPRRSVLFASWDSEERGLLGAWAYTESPTFPLDKIAAVVNMDMVGRNEEVPVGGGARFRGLEVQTAESNENAVNVMGTTRTTMRPDVELANNGVGLELKFRYDNNESQLVRRSDHWPFLHRGVPSVFFHTGLHPDYHTQYDRPEKINYPKMEKVARLVYQTSWIFAEQDQRPEMNRRRGAGRN